MWSWGLWPGSPGRRIGKRTVEQSSPHGLDEPAEDPIRVAAVLVRASIALLTGPVSDGR